MGRYHCPVQDVRQRQPGQVGPGQRDELGAQCLQRMCLLFPLAFTRPRRGVSRGCRVGVERPRSVVRAPSRWSLRGRAPLVWPRHRILLHLLPPHDPVWLKNRVERHAASRGVAALRPPRGRVTRRMISTILTHTPGAPLRRPRLLWTSQLFRTASIPRVALPTGHAWSFRNVWRFRVRP
jgi:hypothetical protein